MTAGALTSHWVIGDLSQKNGLLFTAFLLHRLKPSPECGQYQRHETSHGKKSSAEIYVVSRISSKFCLPQMAQILTGSPCKTCL